MDIVCPRCRTRLHGVPTDFAPRPFCSARCKLLDLLGWLDETHRVRTMLSEEAAGIESPPDEPQH